MNNLTDFYHTG